MLVLTLIGLLTWTALCYGQDATTAITFTMPTGAQLDRVVNASFVNIDNNGDGLVERWEFDAFIIAADTNNDGCMDLTEYQGFSAGGTAIATKIFQHFDPTNSNCITVDKVYDEFTKMDSSTPKDNKVSFHEFEQYYVTLLNDLFGNPAGPVG